MTAPQLAELRGEAILGVLPALAALRIEVFREFPYLYAGTQAYEERYLAHYASAPESLVVVARAAGEIVGAATAMPLALHADAAAPALVAAGYDPATVYYFGESVLRASQRGQGLGRAFLERREATARALGFRVAAFCAVDRPVDHPRRPPDYRPHDAMWQRHGFVRRADIVATFSWQDLDEAAETAKPMVFWTKALA